MIRMVEPREGDVICDPASGSGGFLIRFFEIVREQILGDADKQYQLFKKQVQARKLSDEKKAEILRDKFAEITATLDKQTRESRLWRLANSCIYGVDANDRMARTSKMNMIMHGDGHGGVHHHDGFLNVNGIFEGRFDIILTNPPFGANVEPSDIVHESDLEASREGSKRYESTYGDLYTEAVARVRAAVGKPIASLFELPRSQTSKIKTEILFIERCLSLLKPGGRLGIVLPEGIFSNPSLAYVREFCENRAFVRAIVSLPQETFLSSGASVKASLLFLQKFTSQQQVEFDQNVSNASEEIQTRYASELAGMPKHEEKRIREKMAAETRALVKRKFRYPIFFYEAHKIGISATGEVDENELFPNEMQPREIEKTCIDLYQEFLRDPEPFMLK
jgi:type I restriction enzyme M protein